MRLIILLTDQATCSQDMRALCMGICLCVCVSVRTYIMSDHIHALYIDITINHVS